MVESLTKTLHISVIKKFGENNEILLVKNCGEYKERLLHY